MKTNIAHFFADTLRKRTLTEEQENTLQQLLFPGQAEDPAKALRESTRDFTKALLEWEKGNEVSQKDSEVEPMTGAEIDALAAIM